MPLVLKDGADTTDLPTINLAGQPCFVARLPLRNRIAVALLMPKVKKIVERFPSAEAIKAGAVVELAEDDYLILVDIAVNGLARLYPGVCRDDLLDSDVEIDELFAAWPVVMQQGASRRHAAGEA